MLCERDGAICSGVGVCTQGGACLCDSGKTGAFCDADLDYTILDDCESALRSLAQPLDTLTH